MASNTSISSIYPPGLPFSPSAGVAIYNGRLEALLKKKEPYTEAQKVFAEMRENNLKPNRDTYHPYVFILATADRFQEIWTIFETMAKEHIPLHVLLHKKISILFNKHLKDLSKSASPQTILSTLEAIGLQPNIYLFTTSIDIYTEQKNRESIEELLKKMKVAGISPNEVTLGVLAKFYYKPQKLPQERTSETLITAFATTPAIPPGSPSIKSHVKKTHSSANLLLPVDYKLLLSTKNIFFYIRPRTGHSSFPSLIPFNQRLANVAKDKGIDTERGLIIFREIFREISACHLQPNVKSYTSYLLLFLKANREQDALRLFQSMAQQGIQPDATIFNTLLDYYHIQMKNLACTDKSQEVERIVERIRDIGLIPTEKTYTLLLQAYIHQDDLLRVTEILDKIKCGDIPSANSLFQLLLIFFLKKEEEEIVLELVYTMNQKGFLIDSEECVHRYMKNQDLENSQQISEPDSIGVKLRDRLAINKNLMIFFKKKQYQDFVCLLSNDTQLAANQQEAYIFLLWCHIRQNKTDEIFDILNKMSKENLTLDHLTGLALISLFLKQNCPIEAFEIAENLHIHQVLKNIDHYNELLALFVQTKEIECAGKISLLIQEADLPFNTLTYHLLLDIEILSRHFQQAVELFNTAWPSDNLTQGNGFDDILSCFNCSLGYACTVIWKYVKSKTTVQPFLILTELKTLYSPKDSVKWQMKDDLKHFIQQYLPFLKVEELSQPGLLRCQITQSQIKEHYSR